MSDGKNDFMGELEAISKMQVPFVNKRSLEMAVDFVKQEQERLHKASCVSVTVDDDGDIELDVWIDAYRNIGFTFDPVGLEAFCMYSVHHKGRDSYADEDVLIKDLTPEKVEELWGKAEEMEGTNTP